MFVIFGYKATSLGMIKVYLANDYRFYIATNDALKFKSKSLAKLFYKSNDCLPPIAMQCFIENIKTKTITRFSEV